MLSRAVLVTSTVCQCYLQSSERKFNEMMRPLIGKIKSFSNQFNILVTMIFFQLFNISFQFLNKQILLEGT